MEDHDTLTAANRQALDRQILDNHFRQLIYLFRQIDTGTCSPDWQGWYVNTLDVLVAINDQMPDLYKAAGMDQPMKIDTSDIDRSMAKQRQRERERDRRR